jgi:hypothetical protein
VQKAQSHDSLAQQHALSATPEFGETVYDGNHLLYFSVLGTIGVLQIAPAWSKSFVACRILFN